MEDHFWRITIRSNIHRPKWRHVCTLRGTSLRIQTHLKTEAKQAFELRVALKKTASPAATAWSCPREQPRPDPLQGPAPSHDLQTQAAPAFPKTSPPHCCPGLCQQLSPPHCQPVGIKFHPLRSLSRQITWPIWFLGKVYPSMFNFISLEHWNKGQTHHEPQGSAGARAVPDSMPCPPSVPPAFLWSAKM